MKILIEKTHKAFIMLKIFIQEYLCKCQVVIMSAYFDRHGRLKKENWGDDINYWFLNEITEEKIISYDWSLRTKIFHKPFVSGIGSILTMFSMDNAIVWGSGVLSSTERVIGKPKAVLAVRGPLTRKRLLDQGIDCPEVYGDPALLIPRYYKPNIVSKYKLGIIAHYLDHDSCYLSNLKRDKDVLMIDVRNYDHWLDFIDQICQCEVIASSSLHGLIISEAYSIPNVWIKIKGSELSDDDIKYHDFFLSFGRDREYFLLKENVSKEDLLASVKNWNKTSFDLTKLIKSCPFHLKNNLTLLRN